MDPRPPLPNNQATDPFMTFNSSCTASASPKLARNDDHDLEATPFFYDDLMIRGRSPEVRIRQP